MIKRFIIKGFSKKFKGVQKLPAQKSPKFKPDPGEAATKDVFEADVAEARGVSVEDTPTPTQEKSIRSKLRRDLKIDKPLIDKVKQTVRKTFGTKLPEIESKEFKQALQKAYRTELKTPLAELLGTRENYKKFLEDNFESIYKALPQDILNKRFRQFAEDTGQREKTPEGKTLDKLNLTKICCRRHMLTHVDIE